MGLGTAAQLILPKDKKRLKQLLPEIETSLKLVDWIFVGWEKASFKTVESCDEDEPLKWKFEHRFAFNCIKGSERLQKTTFVSIDV